MHLVAIAWLYVVLMMAAAEATSSGGSVLGALMTFVFYGLLPLGLVLYVLLGPARRRKRRAAEMEAEAAASAFAAATADADAGRHAAGDAVAAKREEP